MYRIAVGAAVTDLVSGTLDFMFAGPSEVVGQIQFGRLKEEVAVILTTEAVQARFRNVGMEPGIPDPAAADIMLQAEVARWGSLVSEAGIQAD